MDAKVFRDKLVGSDEERAVSPVIGVILMVAITVILAAVIATLVMDFGDSTESPINAHVTSETSSSAIELSVAEAGDASEFELRGAGVSTSGGTLSMDASTGAGMTFQNQTTTDGYEFTGGEKVNIVAIDGDREENAGSFEVPENWQNS